MKKLPMNWFYFYTYFLLPFYVLRCLLLIPKLLEIKNPVLSLVIFLYIALNVTVLLGLHKRRIWGWYLNWVSLAFLTLSNIYFIGVIKNVSKAAFLIGGVIYIASNVVYFYKRKVLFTQHSPKLDTVYPKIQKN